MKILRATCECGFRSRKARAGYNFHQWWFPVLDTSTAQLTDRSRSLADDLVSLIQRSKARADELHRVFVKPATQDLASEYADQPRFTFNPEVGSTFRCCNCGREALRIEQEKVTAFCRTDCGLEYQWHDSEQLGCPKCKSRPHRFLADTDANFDGQDRTESCCGCSASMDSASHVDAFCPKCGQLPNHYETKGLSFCGLHHERLHPYHIPGNFLFIEIASVRVANRFPNAKLWGDANTEDSLEGSYCPTCELEHQRWLATEAAD